MLQRAQSLTLLRRKMDRWKESNDMMDGDRIEEILRPFLPFLSLFTQVFDSMPLLSLSLYLLFLLSFNLSCCIWSVQRVWYEIFSSLRSLLLSDRRNEPSKVFPTMPGCYCFCWLIKKKIRHFARKEWVNFCITSNNPFGYEVGNVHVVRWN